MNVKYLCLIFSLPFLLQAAPFADSIVKIKSYYKSSSFPPRIGSGMVIQWQDHKYILTSEHVIYHSNKSFIHELMDSSGHRHFITYLVSDAGRGLALLQLQTEEANLVAFNLDSKNDSPPFLQENITMIGYPVDSDAALINKKGKLNNLKFPSELFVETLELMEVKGGYAEFGMSGGAAFSRQGEYRGLLSHQIINDKSENIILLISAAQVRQWLESILAVSGILKSPSPIDLFQDPAQQVSDFNSYRTAHLYFSFSEPYGAGTLLALVVVPSKNQSTEKFYGGDRGPFVNLTFKPGMSLTCFGFRTAGVLGDLISPPRTIHSWLRKAIDPTVEPLWTYDGGGIVKNVRKARTYYSDFVNFARQLASPSTARLAGYLDTLAFLLQFTPSNDSRGDKANEESLGNWRLIKPKDLDYILNDASLQVEWSEASKISTAHNIRNKLNELKIVMSELTL